MFVFSFLLSLALAGDTVTPSPVSATEAARESYKAGLKAELERLDPATAITRCDAAKASYREAESQLSFIKTELETPQNPTLGSAQAKYHAQLEEAKKSEEAKLVAAKTSAKRRPAPTSLRRTPKPRRSRKSWRASKKLR